MFTQEIQSLKILSNVHINNLKTEELYQNYDGGECDRASFNVNGYFLGQIDCYLFIDDQNFDVSELNYIIPLFVEGMNILIGRQLSMDAEKALADFKLSPPKLTKQQKVTNNLKLKTYSLNLDETIFKIGINFDLKELN